MWMNWWSSNHLFSYSVGDTVKSELSAASLNVTRTEFFEYELTT
jgi:hypothetical protein